MPILESICSLPSLRTCRCFLPSLTRNAVKSADGGPNCYNDDTKAQVDPAIPDFLKRWAERDGCDILPNITKYSDVVQTTSYKCQGKEGFVEGIKFDGQKYGCPNFEDLAVAASKDVVKFFKKHYNGHA